METPKTYELTTINDIFYKLPSDKIEVFALEMAGAFTAAKKIVEVSGVDPKELGLAETHTWIDDGEHTVGMTFSVHGEDHPRARVQIYPEFDMEFFDKDGNPVKEEEENNQKEE